MRSVLYRLRGFRNQHRMRSIATAIWMSLFVALTTFGCRSPEPVEPTTPASIGLPEGAIEAANQITESVLKTPIVVLSDDLMKGRAPSSDGDRLARSYLANQLGELGYSPGSEDGGWEQRFDIIGITSREPREWTFEKDEQRESFKHWDEYVATSGVQEDSSVVRNAEVVFVGYGIQAPEYNWDDFKGEELSGKVLLMLNNDPDWSPDLFEGAKRLYYGRWTYKYESAARQGAAGAIIIHTNASAGYPYQVVQTGWTGEQFELPAEGEPRVQITGWLTEDAARRLVSLAGKNLDRLIESAHNANFHPVPLGITTSITLTNAIHRVSTANVLGVLEGSDPDLSNEAVVFTAHHDHLGIGKPDSTGDDIYNGARDNASGCAEVLAIARAIVALPERPRRSTLILFVGAEESGLLGSKYYASHPTFAPGRIAADINFDSANIWGKTHDLTLIGLGKSTLDSVAIDVAKLQGRVIEPDHFPDRGHYYRSDQFSFARIGVPALYFETGTDFIGRPEGWGEKQINDFTEHRYHQPGDELDDTWNFDGMIEDTRLGFFAGLIIANEDELPSWAPGDEFEAARKAAVRVTHEE